MQSLEEIQSLYHHLRLAIDHVEQGIIVVEAQSRPTPVGPRMVFANQAILNLTGYAKTDLIAQPVGMIFDRDHLRNLIDTLPGIGASGVPLSMECDLHIRGDRRERCEWKIVPVNNNQGTTVNFTLLIRPLTEKSTLGSAPQSDPLNEDLGKSRLESLQIVSNGIAHDFRNCLATARMAIELARPEIENPASELLELLSHAETALDSGADLATQMIEFTKGEESKVRVLNLHGLLQKTARMSTVGNNVTPELSIQPDLWDVAINPVQIQQVFQNIIINGCQAMPHGGPMHISARNATVSPGNSFGLPAGNYVVVGIRDRGCGIPKEVIPKIFEPYFTTKPKGTGIGLASCKQIVERHRGKIMVESMQNVGSEFIIFLPIASTTQLSAPEVRPSPNQILGGATRELLEPASKDSAKKRILIVDDNAPFRKLAVKMGEFLGMEAVEAKDGEEALIQIRHAFLEARSFAAVFLDLNLPKLGGAEVMEEIRKLDRSVKVILSTGDVTAEAEASGEWDAVLTKPYGKDKMAAALASVMRKGHHQVPVQSRQ